MLFYVNKHLKTVQFFGPICIFHAILYTDYNQIRWRYQLQS